MFDLYEELIAIIDTLESREIEYALCGGMAMAVHGFTRATEDIDLFLPPNQTEAAEAAVGNLGYVFKAHPMSFSSGAMQIRRLSKIDSTDGDTMTLDFLLVTPATAGVWESRQTLFWRERRISVVSRDGLITLKKFRSSKQDLADIERLENE